MFLLSIIEEADPLSMQMRKSKYGYVENRESRLLLYEEERAFVSSFVLVLLRIPLLLFLIRRLLLSEEERVCSPLDERFSGVIRGSQRFSEALRGFERFSEVSRGVERF